MRYQSSLVAALWIAVLAIGGAEAGLEALDKYLVDKVKDGDIKANLQAASEFLKELEVAKPSIFSIKNPINDVKLFVSLQQVVDDTQCDKKTMQIIIDNQARGDNKERRVDLVLREIFSQHAKRCSELYPSKFEAIKSQFGESAYKRVEAIGDQVIDADQDAADSWEREMAENSYYLENIIDRYVLGRFSIVDSGCGDNLLVALKGNAKGSVDAVFTNKVVDERTGKSAVHKDRIKELVKEQLVQPCKDYLAKFGDDLFVPARVDAQWQLSKVDPFNADFYLGWAYFTICSSLIDNRSIITNEIIRSLKG